MYRFARTMSEQVVFVLMSLRSNENAADDIPVRSTEARKSSLPRGYEESLDPAAAEDVD